MNMTRQTRARANPRYQGTITSWKDEQGFGFITPNGGGPSVFVHVKSFTSHATRPALAAIVTYELGVNDKGQPRAANVAFAGDQARRRAPARSAGFQLLVAAGFLALVALAVMAQALPGIVVGVYLGASALTFIAYARDKSAARNARRRTPENTLHLLALAGGWPGAMLAQQLLRHKSSKPSFRAGFWCTVVVNCAILGWLLSAPGSALLRSLPLAQ